MSKLSEKQLLLLTVGIALLLSGGLGFLIWSDLKEVGQEEDTIAGLKEQIDAAQREIDQIPAREFRVIANREIADKEVAHLPEENEIETFWEVLERFAVESGVKISKIAGGDANPTSRRGAKSQPIERVEQLLSLRGSAEEFLRFVNLIENYDRIITITEFQVTPGKLDPVDGKYRHQIRLALATFTYKKKLANTIVSINQYEKKKEHTEVKQWLSRIKVQEKENYTLRTSLGRRDPFVDVRRKIDPNIHEAELANEAAQQAMLQTLVSHVRTLEEDLKVEDHLRQIKDLFRLSQQVKENRDLFRQLGSLIDDVRRDGSITIRELQERFREEVEKPYKALAEKIGSLESDGPPLTREQVLEYHKRVAAAFDERQWKRLAEEVRSFNDISENGNKVAEDAQDLAREIAGFQHRADVIQEFEKRKIEISTILYSPNAVSVAVINNKMLAENDALDGDGQVILVEIGESYVIFQTQGVEIKRSMQR